MGKRSTITDAKKALNALVKKKKKGLNSESGECKVPGMGKFKVVLRPARKARNPITGEAVDVPEKEVIKYKPWKGF